MAIPYTRHLVPIDMLYVERPELDKHWKERAACREHQELFLADYEHKQIAENRKNEQKTQRICIDCPVRAHCLWNALDAYEKDFMWGGLNPDQRKLLRRRLRMKEDVA